MVALAAPAGAVCAMEGPPLSMVSGNDSVFAIATPVRVERASGPSLADYSAHYGFGLPVSAKGLEAPSQGELTVFEVEWALQQDTPERIEVYRPDGLLVGETAVITPWRKGLYRFDVSELGYALSECNGGYTAKRVMHFAETGEDDHWTAREVCGHSVYEWSRGSRYGLDPEAMGAQCRAEYERTLERGRAGENRAAHFGQPLSD